MKRLMFGIMLTLVGLSYSLVCFATAVSNPWRAADTAGLTGVFLGSGTMFPFLLSLTILLTGLVITLFETYRKR